MPSDDQPLHGVDQVVVHPARELALGRVGERLPEPGRAAVVDLQHGVAAVGEHLGLGVVAPGVARPRAAVDDEHRGQAARLHAEGQREVAVQREAVAGGDRDRRHRRERRRVQPRPRAEEELRRAGPAVEEERRAGVAVVVERDDPRGLRGVLPGDPRVAVVQRAHGLPVAGQALVEGVHHHAVAQVHGAEQLAGAVADDRAAEVDLLVAVDLALGAVGRVELHQPHQVAAAGAPDPQPRAVGGEGVGLAAVLVRELGHDAQLVLLGVAHEELVVARRGLGERRAQAALAVGLPAEDVARGCGRSARGGRWRASAGRRRTGERSRRFIDTSTCRGVARGAAIRPARTPAKGSGRGRGRRPRRPRPARGGSRRRRCPACRGSARSRATTGRSARRGRGRR